MMVSSASSVGAIFGALPLVDLSVWCLNLRGSITDMALATVKLLSKEDKYPDAKKVIKR
jgi:hypothetical protein